MPRDASSHERATLRRGWTTGSCATAAAKAAAVRLVSGEFPDPVTITLPKGQTPSFPLALEGVSGGRAICGIVKDAGDDPDVTHGATVIASVGASKAPGVRFRAGEGVGTITKAGLPLPVGEPAINPVPRSMIERELAAVSKQHEGPVGWDVELSVPGGEALAGRTWNPRLGIVGGLSILGTTGIVNPFSCAAWIHSIHRGIDVARASGCGHVVGSTGSTSEGAARLLYPELPLHAYLDMGDFAGGLLKYLRDHPVERLTITGGFAKLTKLAQGALDLHSGRSQVSFDFLADRFTGSRREEVAKANTAAEVLGLAGPDAGALAGFVAARARDTAIAALRGAPVAVDILVVDRAGTVIARKEDRR